ncbi:MAG: hypothetical protein Q8L39_11400, partial [Burkholderiales bacterium]|nr:hypothetical protein [Burkholderiales bacterium]
MTPLKISWLTEYLAPGPIDPSSDSPMASIRYRITLPALQFAERGHDVSVLNPSLLTAGTEREHALDVLVVPKQQASSVEETVQWQNAALALADKAKQRGALIVADYCDYHIDTPILGPFQKALASLADVRVASTKKLSSIMSTATGLNFHVISDPIEGPRGNAEYNPPESRKGIRAIFSASNPLRLLWFGHEFNFGALYNFAPQLETLYSKNAIELVVVTNPMPAIVDSIDKLGNIAPKHFKLRLQPWSRSAVWHELQQCHCVLIPAQLENPKVAVKSPNRLIESLWAGKWVLAHPIPSYEELGQWAWVKEDLISGHQWGMEN